MLLFCKFSEKHLQPSVHWMFLSAELLCNYWSSIPYAHFILANNLSSRVYFSLEVL